MYCTANDILKMKDALVIAKWIRLPLPEILTDTQYNVIYNQLSTEHQDIFSSAYELKGTDYLIRSDLDYDIKIGLVEIYLILTGVNFIEQTIMDVDAEINLYLTSGGYQVPIALDNVNYPLVKRYSKYLSLYNLMLLGGVTDKKADIKFIEACEKMKKELEKIAEGKMKLPSSLNAVSGIAIKSEQKITTWEEC